MKQLEELTVQDVLQEFVQDVEVVHGKLKKQQREFRREWPDLAYTYDRAQHVLAKYQQMRYDSKKPLRIKQFLFKGQTSGEATNVRDLLEELGRLLDKAYSHEIFGDVVFEAEDGIRYVATVEGVIGQVDAKYLRELQDAEEDDGE